jgi:uncharacterized OB-fold protein
MSKSKPPITITDTTAPFWEGVKHQRLMLQYDLQSQRYQFYPRPLSLFSEGPTEWREASGFGTLVAFTLTHFPAPGFDAELPYLEGLIKLDEGPRIFSPLTGASLHELIVGQRMRIVYGVGGHVFQFQPNTDFIDSTISFTSKDFT